jgi:hypothetical protein
VAKPHPLLLNSALQCTINHQLARVVLLPRADCLHFCNGLCGSNISCGSRWLDLWSVSILYQVTFIGQCYLIQDCPDVPGWLETMHVRLAYSELTAIILVVTGSLLASAYCPHMSIKLQGETKNACRPRTYYLALTSLLAICSPQPLLQYSGTKRLHGPVKWRVTHYNTVHTP